MPDKVRIAETGSWLRILGMYLEWGVPETGKQKNPRRSLRGFFYVWRRR